MFALLAVLGHFYLGDWLASDFTLTDEQKAILFTADDFAKWSGEWQPAGTAQTVFTGLRYFDGSMELDYDFQDDEDDEAPYIYSLVTIERNAFEARSAYAGQKVGERIGSWWDDGGEDGEIKLVQSNAVFSWGDKSEYAMYTAGDGEAYGAQLHALSGNKVVFIVITGSFDPADPDAVSALLTPALERLKAYAPKPAGK